MKTDQEGHGWYKNIIKNILLCASKPKYHISSLAINKTSRLGWKSVRSAGRNLVTFNMLSSVHATKIVFL